ncbi:hypothetical protein G9A89_002244 [Geosiphon pyriformis]|nr:hypothetical protein G9A89_002244 [Geosiphon pyriformis]
MTIKPSLFLITFLLVVTLTKGQPLDPGSLNTNNISSLSLTGTPLSNLTGTPLSNLTGTPASNLTGTPALNLTGIPISNLTSLQPADISGRVLTTKEKDLGFTITGLANDTAVITGQVNQLIGFIKPGNLLDISIQLGNLLAVNLSALPGGRQLVGALQPGATNPLNFTVPAAQLLKFFAPADLPLSLLLRNLQSGETRSFPLTLI